MPVSAGTPGLIVLPAVPKDVVPSHGSLVMHAFLSGSGALVILQKSHPNLSDSYEVSYGMNDPAIKIE